MIDLNLQKKLDGAQGLLKLDFQLKISSGEIIGIMGKSGEGKSSLLNMMAGLLEPDSGFIRYGMKTWYSSIEKTWVPPQKRHVGMVFQDYALFPNYTVLQNILFAAKNKLDAQELLNKFELVELSNKKPMSLSGGQQQRVAIARALMYQPKLLLLDEALAAVDDQMRLKIQSLILEYHQKYNPIIIMVSHRRSELLQMTNHIYSLENGKIHPLHSPKKNLVTLSILQEQNGTFTLRDTRTFKIYTISKNLLPGKQPGQEIQWPLEA